MVTDEFEKGTSKEEKEEEQLDSKLEKEKDQKENCTKKKLVRQVKEKLVVPKKNKAEEEIREIK